MLLRTRGIPSAVGAQGTRRCFGGPNELPAQRWLGALAGFCLGWGAVAGPVPEPGWVMRATVEGMLPGSRPSVVIRVRAGAEVVEVPGLWTASDGVVGVVAEVPLETRLTGDVPTLGRLPLAQEPVVWSWVMAVDGVELPSPAGAGTVVFGPKDRGRVDGIRVHFAVRAVGDTYATWSRRIFGRETPIEDDPDGDGRTNGAEFAGGSNPLDPTSVPGDGESAPLRAVLDGADLVLRWPASDVVTAVEESSELGGTWQPLPVNPLRDGPAFVVRIRPAANTRFYRLTRP